MSADGLDDGVAGLVGVLREDGWCRRPPCGAGVETAEGVALDFEARDAKVDSVASVGDLIVREAGEVGSRLVDQVGVEGVDVDEGGGGGQGFERKIGDRLGTRAGVRAGLG